MPTTRRKSALPPPVEFAFFLAISNGYALTKRCVSILVFCLVLTPAFALAQNAESARLIDQGLNLRERGEHQAALVLFERAARIEPTPRVTAQIALAHHALGHYRIAREKLIEAISQSRDTWIRSRSVALQEAQLDCEAHLARITITGGEPGDVIVVSNEERATLPLSEPLYNEAGDVTFRLMRNGELVGATRAELVANADVAVRFDVATVAAVIEQPVVEPEERNEATVIEPAPQTDSARTSWRVPVGWTAIGLGAAGLATGVAFNAMREDVLDEYNSTQYATVTGGGSSCPTNPSGAQDGTGSDNWANKCRPLFDRGATYRTALLAGYITGGILVAAGAVLLLLPNNEHATTQARVQCVPSFGQLNGLACGGEF